MWFVLTNLLHIDFEQKTEGNEVPFETPEFMENWSDHDKADFVYQMLTTLPPYHVFKIVDRISPYLNRNILSQLPYEIGLHILSFLDVHSLTQASLVCRGWHTLCEEPSLWRNLFESQGWRYDRKEMADYLKNSPEEDDYHAGSSGNGFSSGGSHNEITGTGDTKAISPVPIARTSPPMIGRSKWSKIYRLRNNNSSKPPFLKAAPAKTELEEFHYDPVSDTRFINWQRLYRNRHIIENRWSVGSCRTRKFPLLGAAPESDLHGEGIYCLQFDKEKLVSGSRDRSIKVWDIVTGKCKQTLRGHEGSVLCLQYDEKDIVSGSSDFKIMITDLETGSIKKVLRGHLDSVLSLRLVRDDKIVSCSKDRTLRIWDRETGECLKILRGHKAAVNAVQWKDDLIISASGDRTIKVWSLTTGECLRTLAAHTRGVACVEFDGKHIISGSSDQTIKVWDADTGDCIYTLVGHTDLVRTLQLDTSSNRMVSGCYNGHLKTWDITQGQLIRDLGQATGGRILNLRFDFSKIICCSNDTRLTIYDFAYDINTKFLCK